MRIKGKLIGAPESRLCVFERGEEKYVFTINAVLDYTEFDKLCPTPSPPKVTKPGGVALANPESPIFLEKLTKYSIVKTSWLILKALEQTEGLEWDDVNMEDPDTWDKYKDELMGSGLTEGEVAHLINQIYLVNSLDESKMNEARDRFIRGKKEEKM